VDTGVAVGSRVSPLYDSLLFKEVAHGSTRGKAMAVLSEALNGTVVGGVSTNITFLRKLLATDELRNQTVHTKWIQSDFLPLFNKEENEKKISIASLAIGATLCAISSEKEQDGGDEKECIYGTPFLRPATNFKFTKAYYFKAKDNAGSFTVPVDVIIEHNADASDNNNNDNENPKGTDDWSVRAVCGDEKIAFQLQTSLIKRSPFGDPSCSELTAMTKHLHGKSELVNGVVSREKKAKGTREKDQFACYLQQSNEPIIFTTRNSRKKEIIDNHKQNTQPQNDGKKEKNIVYPPLPGKVVAFLCEDGSKVNVGDKVCLIEAMKMEHQVICETEGKIRFLAKIGESVNESQAVAVVEGMK
jgi:acetyl/propionyl-CoA carboxylase alpha subunit